MAALPLRRGLRLVLRAEWEQLGPGPVNVGLQHRPDVFADGSAFQHRQVLQVAFQVFAGVDVNRLQAFFFLLHLGVSDEGKRPGHGVALGNRLRPGRTTKQTQAASGSEATGVESCCW